MSSFAEQSTSLTVVSWDDFSRLFRKHHKQGEHVAIVGQTGSGKSVLGCALCQIVASRKGRDGRPARVVALGTKPRDDTMRTMLVEKDWPIVKKWPPSYGQEHCVVWPRSTNPETATRIQRATFRPLLNTIYHEGGQTVFIDEESDFEESYPEDGLGLRGTMVKFWTKGRGLKLTLIAGTQRPRNVTRSMWSEPSWVYVFAPDDEDDLRRVAELSGAREQVLEIADNLGGHEFLCIRRQRDQGVKQLYVSKVGQ